VFVPYPTHRRLSEYTGQPGPEIGGLLLTPWAYEALADSKTSGLPCELVVIGEDRRRNPDGSAGERFLVYAVPTEYIEATTSYRLDRETHLLRLVCQECGLRDGKHRRMCDAAR
jgi:hypothetical protein